MKEIDLTNWDRAIQYDFFKDYEDPFFNICGNLEVTKLYGYCKKNNYSFFLASLFVAIKSMNEIPAFKLRIKNGKVYEMDKIHIDSTVLNEDNTFSFCHFEFKESIQEFIEKAGKTLSDHKKGVVFDPREDDLDIVHSTTIPWVSITSFKHARNGNEKGIGIPKTVFGKYFRDGNTLMLPFSIEVHHALMDGIHVGLLFEKMQQYIDTLS